MADQITGQPLSKSAKRRRRKKLAQASKTRERAVRDQTKFYSEFNPEYADLDPFWQEYYFYKD